ncbi:MULTISPECIES: LytTR family DNA-binding domain-containing protein [unclassified Sphingomonas]|nr:MULTISPECIES: LytTR family DNA-binding domain-containing protein [unclassified Sphingomonas]
MSAATALALFAFLLGYGIGGLEAHSGSFAAEHPDETRLARLLVWGAMLTIAWASRKPMRELLEAPKRSPLLLGAFAFVPVLLTELAASRFAIAISPYQLCGPNGPPPMPVDNFLPRAIALGSTAWLSLMAWSRHLANRRGLPEADEPFVEPQPALSAPPSAEQWLSLPEAPFLRVRASDVTQIRSAGNYSEILAHGRVHLVRAPLSELAARFADLGFVRVHRQVVVNRQHVSQIYREASGRLTVQLRCGAIVALGRSYRTALAAFAH